jgi:Mn2+/Fe2+ NRAMP family transporter
MREQSLPESDAQSSASPAEKSARDKTWWKRLAQHPLLHVGSGLITGVADDDPSGIATYSQAGAQFGLNMLWTMPLSFPMMGAVQSMCARIGRVTGKGLAANIKQAFPPYVLKGVVLMLLFANTLNIAADIAAMGEAAELVTSINRHIMTVCFVVMTLAAQIAVPYHRYVHYLKWLTLSLLAYAAVLFTVHVPWKAVAWRTLWPHLHLDGTAATVIVGVFGTTISPYLFFWQASEEIEDMHLHADAKPLRLDPAAGFTELLRIKWDTWGGMFYSNLAAYFIILATAVTLHVAGITDITTAAQAASALQPLAGEFAAMVFALGVLGVGLIGVPVLAGSASYALCEAMDWRWGLERSAKDARGFYGVITVSVLAALAIQYSSVPPMKALFWSAVVNGVVAVPLIVVIVVIASKPSMMGEFTAPRLVRCLGWTSAFVMGVTALYMLVPL